VPNKLPVIPAEALTHPVMVWFPTNVFEPVVANELVFIFPPPPFKAYEAVVAYEAVPKRLPVIPPVTSKLPVI
jgi:hypothetical protein